MSKTQILIIIFTIIALVIAAYVYVIPYLKKKGFNTKGILDKTEQGLEDAGAVLDVVGELKPSNALNVLNIIREFALDATRGAQQLYISSQLPLDQRRQTAKDEIINGLKIFNIPITADIEKLINIIIERMVFDSKTDDEKRGQEQSTLQKQINQLQQDKTQLQTSNANIQQQVTALQQKITTVQNTVAQ